MTSLRSWADVSGELAKQVLEDNLRTRRSYAELPEKIASDHRSEQEVYEGDYRRRQVFELIQNGADAITAAGDHQGRVEVLLTQEGLYCANEGEPFSAAGLLSLRFQLWSSKSGNQIGRFGRGFKSVLALTDQPRIYSRSGSFTFSRRKAKQFLLGDERISADHVGAALDEVPILSIAEPLDPAGAAKDDPDLAQFMEWATTIIHLPFTAAGRFVNFTPAQRFELIENDLVNFPPEFLIFTKHVDQLRLGVRGPKPWTASFSAQVTERDTPPELEAVGLYDCEITSTKGDPARWTLLELPPVSVPLTVEGLSVNRRLDEHGHPLPVPLAWAVPAQATQVGKFWSFFPTRDETTLRGILNAPWDTNTERTRLLENAYNRFLVERFADLVVRAIPFLQGRNTDDPGAYLEFLPARGREQRSAADDWITTSVNNQMAVSASLPDLDGVMHVPNQLRRPPDAVGSDVLVRWSETPGAPRDFVHPATIEGNVRPGRVNLYMEAAGGDAPVGLAEWLELLVAVPTPEASIGAIALAQDVSSVNLALREKASTARVVLTSDGTLVAPDPANVYLPIKGRPVAGLTTVHSAVATDPVALAALTQTFELRVVDESARLEQLLASWSASPTDPQWEQLWELVTTVAPESAIGLLRDRLGSALQVRARDRRFRPLIELLLVGDVVHAGADLGVTIDDEYHAAHMQVLQGLGAAPRPIPMPAAAAPWLDQYRAQLRTELLADRRSERTIVDILDALPDVPSHLHLVHRLSADAAARLCDSAVRLPEILEPWKSALAGRDFESPTRWFLRQFGIFPTSLGPRPVSDTLASTVGDEFRKCLPVTVLPPHLADELGFVSQLEQLPAGPLLEALGLLSDEVDDERIGRILAVVVRVIDGPPPSIPCRRGQGHVMLAPSEVIVVSDPALFHDTTRTGAAAVRVPDPESQSLLVERWGMQGPEALVEDLIYEGDGEPALLSDEFFLLGQMFGRRVTGKRVQTCRRLVRVIATADGQAESEASRAMDGDTVVVRCGSEDHVSILRAASGLLGLDLDQEQIDAIIDNRRSVEAEEKIARVRAQPSDEDRIRVLFTPEMLTRLLPSNMPEEVGCASDDHATLVKLVLAVRGPELLDRARADLLQMGLQPPVQWGGSAPALRFVRELGFDPSFAGFKKGDRTAEFKVPGPTDLKPLHDYQLTLTGELQQLVRRRRPSKDGGWRGLLFLPTGAGKTRVAVQALLDMAEGGELEGKVILWVAQSDELCEQAVQAFREVWGAIGKSGELVIGRLWGDNHVESAADTNDEWRAQVIVATVAKMSASVVGTERYAWLRECAVVVADEAHTGTSQEYTTMLRWLGTGVRRQGEDERPLIGLTATPFKTGDKETATLRSRFGKNLLQIRPDASDGKEWSMTGYLRSIGVLARARHEVLGGANVALDDEELRAFTNKGGGVGAWLPTTVEGRIAADRDRNQTLIDSISGLPEDWPAIVFAVSVAHAQVLAAQLKIRGIEAAAISASTAPGARHHHIKEFRKGRTRVLTNYGVLTTGFDAPETRAIYVARPTFSVSLYMQMIGRGLRGPLNGGKDECLIVDVRDNIERFGGAFAFDQVDRLWADVPDIEDDMDPDAWADGDDDEDGGA
jgi:superfamily II DNA or RNA helicase